jgi:hypothetical protein
MPDLPWRQYRAEDKHCQLWPYGGGGERPQRSGLTQSEILTYLLVGIHRSEAAVMARLAAFAGNFLDLFLGPVGKISWVVVAGHCDRYGIVSEDVFV